MRWYLAIIMTILINTAANAEEVITLSDGCVVEMIGTSNNPLWRVTNPITCPDKALVKNLNCWDKLIFPISERPAECAT